MNCFILYSVLLLLQKNKENCFQKLKYFGLQQQIQNLACSFLSLKHRKSTLMIISCIINIRIIYKHYGNWRNHITRSFEVSFSLKPLLFVIITHTVHTGHNCINISFIIIWKPFKYCR